MEKPSSRSDRGGEMTMSLSLLSKEGKTAFRKDLTSNILFAFDFDGTLAPIQERPESVRITPKFLPYLERCKTIGKVAVVSGRSVEDLKSRMDFRPDFMIGNHGLEGFGSPPFAMERARELVRTWQDQLKRNKELWTSGGIWIEDKIYSLSLHYRQAADPEGALVRLLEQARALDPLPRIVLGKRVVNLVSADAPHKGDALLKLIQDLAVDAALFIGDDDTDEDVFRLEESRIIGIRIGNPNETSAKYYVEKQTDLLEVFPLIVP
jgi:trehalose 6-phosphate phosphatase